MPCRYPRVTLPLAALVTLFLLLDCDPSIHSDSQQALGPKAVYIIRHAEKPGTDGGPHLSPKGVERAAVLANVFPGHFVRPDYIFASAASKRSARPLETVQPLAKALQIKIQDAFSEDEIDKLAHEILTQPRYAGKTVLICWHHGQIPGLATALGARKTPEKWKPDVFDRVWLLTYTDDQVRFQDLAQRALPGDSQN